VGDDRWRQVCHPGHINKYALFTELCFRLAAKDGLVVLVLPSSFVAGPLYGRLRSFVRSKGEVLALSSVTKRDDVFVDVAQDVSILLVRSGKAHDRSKLVAFGTYANTFKVTSSSALPEAAEGPWISSASASSLTQGCATLTDYGATLRSGYFVWNREKERMFKRGYSKLYVPLIWARNIQAGGYCQPAARKRNGVDFVRFAADSDAIVRTDALVMQRTTNSAQPRRLIVARVSPSVIAKWGGFVSENHTITIAGPGVPLLNALALLLNSAAVDARYRLLSGTASVSVNLLRKLDLPRPQCLLDAIEKHGVCEAAVEEAYRMSAMSIAEVAI
jgi:adenine-specific DNA-methyltransferase